MRLGGIQRSCPPAALTRPVVAVFAGDHGVHAQGVTPWPQEVTASMIENFRAGGAAVNVLARQAGADVFVVDMGVAADLAPGPRPDRPQGPPRYVGPGDRPRDDQGRGRGRAAGRRRGRATGWSTQGYDCLLTGDMGIANTTPSAALIAAFTGLGAGPGHRARHRRRRPDAGPQGRGGRLGAARAAGRAPTRSRRWPRSAASSTPASPGFVLGAAARRVPVILDGVIAGAAALVAQALAPDGRRTTASPGTAASSPVTSSPSSASACARSSTSTCGSARAPVRCWPSRSSRRPVRCCARWRPSTPPGWPARTPTRER